ncbi:MAG: hypothetical protein AAB334_00850 [Patescibacteria group bacterium]
MNKKRKLFITLGIIIFLIPLLGIPTGWKYFFTIILGLWVALSSFLSERTLNDVISKLIGVRIEKIKVKLHKNEDAFSLKVIEKKENPSDISAHTGQSGENNNLETEK